LVGQSGCGKSTLARIILKLLPPSGGKVFFKGRDITAAPARELSAVRRKMQIIFQHPETALNPRMKIYASLAEPMRIQKLVANRNEEKARVSDLLEQVGLAAEHLTRYPHELSGGQIQRVVLARILSLHPEFIVADEPTSMLDVSVQAQVLNIFKNIQKQYHLAYLFISHDLEVIRCMSDRIAVMYRGRIIETGPADAVYKNPQHPYTSLLVNTFASFNDQTHQISGGPAANPGSLPAGCVYAPYCFKASAVCEQTPDFKETTKEHYVACWHV